MDKAVCSAVHHGLCITAYGAVNPCCATSFDFKHITEIDNIVDYFYTNKDLEFARQTELTDTWLEECNGCKWKAEQGLVSRKDKMLNWFPHADINFTNENKYAIIHMDISFGNSCNQKCIMCNSNFSSQWLKDDILMMDEAPYIRQQQNLQLKNWSLSYDHLDQIASLVSEHTKKIEIKGGEPLYDKRFEYFVNKVLEINPNIAFSTNTNGTHFNQKNIDMLNRIKKINIDISFDGIGKTFEWIRNTNWKDAEENYERCLQYVNHTPNLNYTTMIYNLDHFEEFYNWAADMSEKYNKPIACHFTQVVNTPKYISPSYASKKRLESGIQQIERIVEDPRGVCSQSSIFKPRLELLKTYLIQCLDKKVDINDFEKTHLYMTKVRGWDIKEYVDM
jgi:molybdenum cofactor biosynthesis enzyme MoaA